jgi:hypothetical protein
MSDTSLKSLDWDTLVCFTQGLIEVAKVDGIQPKETQFIRAFFKEEISHIPGKEESHFRDIKDLPFDIAEAKKHLNTDELKEYFFKSCVMLACVDTFSDEEEQLIGRYAGELNFPKEKLDQIIDQVQQELLAQFSDITIYSDSLKEVARSIGVKDTGK